MLPSGMLAWCRYFFFFQAEDGIRDVAVTGVQTCALPISGFPYVRPRVARSALEVCGSPARRTPDAGVDRAGAVPDNETQLHIDTSFRTEIGRASCRERV